MLFFADLQFVQAMLEEGDQEILLGYCALGVSALTLGLVYSLAREMRADWRRRRRSERLEVARRLQGELDARFPRRGVVVADKGWGALYCDADFYAGLKEDREGRDS